MSRSIYALRIVKVTNPMLDRRFWVPGMFVAFSSAESQEPALGFGNFDTFNPVPLTEATFYKLPLNAAAGLASFEQCVSGVEVEIVAFTETATSSHRGVTDAF